MSKTRATELADTFSKRELPQSLSGLPIAGVTTEIGEWTRFFNNDDPQSDSGDKEMADPGAMEQICNGNPATAIYCQTTSGKPWFNVTREGRAQKLMSPCTLQNGLVCRNSDNSDGCLDYMVQLLCPKRVPAPLRTVGTVPLQLTLSNVTECGRPHVNKLCWHAHVCVYGL